MAGSVNKVILVGNLGKDPEIRTTQSGEMIANFSIATSETWRDKSTGERKEKTEWHRVVVFNDNLARVVNDYVRKGQTVYVEGSLQTRKWTDQQGVEKYTTEVILQRYGGTLTLLGGKRDGAERPPAADSQDDYGQIRTRTQGHDAKGRSSPPSQQQFDLDDEIPF